MNGKPWFDWYKWHNRYWDTKWNAYETYTYTGKDLDGYWVEFEFQTAWCAPMAIVNRLKLLGYPMKYKWADEDWGSNCGKGMYNPEETGFTDWVFTYAEEMDDPRRFAAEEVWGYDYDDVLEEEREEE